MLMVQSRLGDKLLNYVAMSSHGAIDDEYLMVECSEDRASAMKDAMELIGVRKMKRKVRTRVTIGEPTDAWRRLLFKDPITIGKVALKFDHHTNHIVLLETISQQQMIEIFSQIFSITLPC
jgi:hypothetical protein